MLNAIESTGGPGSIELRRSEKPVVRAKELLYVHFERPDLDRTEAYLRDFGLILASKTATELTMRGAGPRPCIYRATLGSRARFIGFALSVETAEELETLARTFNSRVETAQAPGGGKVVRLTDPLGVTVEVLSGFTPCETVPLRAPIPHNAPNDTVRVNATQRPIYEPPQVTKLGHLVLETPDFDASVRWYMDTFGFIPSDVMCLQDGTPVGAFMRLDRGVEPSDHHTLFVATSMESGADHVAFEVVDLDAIEMGQQIMMANRYRHAWGVGRHLLGSQIFDYWRDPWGQKHEHYADGDLFDSEVPTGYHLMDRAGLYQWGPDLPDDFVDAKLTPRRVWKLLKLGLRNKAQLKRFIELKNSMSKPPREWNR